MLTTSSEAERRDNQAEFSMEEADGKRTDMAACTCRQTPEYGCGVQMATDGHRTRTYPGRQRHMGVIKRCSPAGSGSPLSPHDHDVSFPALVVHRFMAIRKLQDALEWQVRLSRILTWGFCRLAARNMA